MASETARSSMQRPFEVGIVKLNPLAEARLGEELLGLRGIVRIRLDRRVHAEIAGVEGHGRRRAWPRRRSLTIVSQSIAWLIAWRTFTFFTGLSARVSNW